MSTTTHSPNRTATRNWPAWAVGSAGVSAVLTAIGTFWSPLADYESTQTMGDFISYLVVLGTIAVAVGIAFGLVVRTATPERADRRGLILALVAVPTIAVFWTGFPMVFAGAGACLALSQGRISTVGRITLAVGVLVTAAAVALALAG